MGKRYIHRLGLALLAAVLCFGAMRAYAAGDWEWTEGQGWVMGAGVSRPTAREQLHYAYELEQRGEFMDSARQYFLLVQNFPDSEEAGVGLQRLARCLFEMENYYTSYKAIEQVIKTYPSTGRMTDLVEIELRIAKRLMLSGQADILSDTRSDPYQTRVNNVRRALEIIDSVLNHDPYGPVAAEAYLVRGEGNLFINEIARARTAFQTVTDDFPRSDYVERARLGLIRCDSLMGQARPQELMEQMEVVREEERRRRESGVADDGDDVDESFRQLAEVEAAKMMDQARQYERMGTRSAVKAADFLYKEIVRRYPGTPQAEDALAKSGSLKIPAEQGRFAHAVRNINLNPFTWNKDPEPPWIVPQMAPEDQVMVDAGLGPIVGVPESGMPQTANAAGLRPAALSTADSGAGWSPASDAPGLAAAPAFIDGTVGSGSAQGWSARTSAGPQGSGFTPQSQPTMLADIAPLPPARQSPFAGNPLSSVTESDLIDVGGGTPVMASYTPPAAAWSGSSGNLPPAPAPAAPVGPPVLGGSVAYNAPMSDLVGTIGTAPLQPQPVPSYTDPGYYQPQPQYPAPNGYYAPPAPQPTYVDPGYAPVPAAPQPYGSGWMLSEDFR